jgi:putative membrane protein
VSLASAPPYCGPPPRPPDLAAAWNLDPGLLLSLVALAAAYALAARWSAGRGRLHRRIGAFIAGWAVLALAFVTPLCALGVALFAARAGQHLLLVSVAAPLLAAAMTPFVDSRGAAPEAVAHGGSAHGRSRGVPAGLSFAVLFWFWHAPAPYAATLRSDFAYWAMHLSLLISASWVWHVLLRARHGERFALGLGTSLQMGLLGALLVLAPRPLYASHATTTAPWGLSPLADQALGGVLCWTLGCLPFAVSALVALAALVGRSSSTEEPAEAAPLVWPPDRSAPA